MRNDSEFLTTLIGKPVRIVAIDEENLKPLVLQEISQLGVVAARQSVSHFFPWNEIVEISPAEISTADRIGDRELVEAALGVDSEP